MGRVSRSFLRMLALGLRRFWLMGYEIQVAHYEIFAANSEKF
jgi:hypothetical protein